MQFEGHPCAWLHIKVESMLLRVGVESCEILQLALREVEVGVGESCGRTLALRGKQIILDFANNPHDRGLGCHRCSPL